MFPSQAQHAYFVILPFRHASFHEDPDGFFPHVLFIHSIA